MKTVTLLKVPGDEVKTPQIQAMLAVLNDTTGVGTATSLSDLFEKIDADERFKSRQGAARVFKFYTKKMVEDGLIAIEGADEKPAKEAAEGAAEKPKRGKKAKDVPADAPVDETAAA